MNRRSFLKYSSAGTIISISGLFGPLQKALAQGNSHKFVLYVHCGSWDGWSAGLLQPKDVGDYPIGVFERNRSTQSVNPNINKHYKEGNLVLNDYSKPLISIADHVCFATANPLSVGHFAARRLQSSGSATSGATSNPGWASGLAQMNLGGKPSSFVISSARGAHGTELASTTPNVVNAFANTIPEIEQNFSDPSLIRILEGKNEFTEAVLKIQERNFDKMKISPEIRGSYSSSLKAVSQGIANVDEKIAAIEQAISRARVDDYINLMADSAGVKAEGTSRRDRGYENTLLKKLQMAALLIENQLASGLSLGMDNQDFHGGGASVITARSSAQLWAQLTVFWEWVKSKGLQNDVMVVVSHEFSRTAYNGAKAAAVNVVYQDESGNPATKAVEAPGCDHHLSCGVVFINGRVPPKSRVGGIGDYYTAAGSKDLKGIADFDVPAYTTMQIVGTMMMRVWPDLFPTFREVRKIWPNFSEEDVISMLVES